MKQRAVASDVRWAGQMYVKKIRELNDEQRRAQRVKHYAR
jgi:uncharacterized Zn finger protein